MRVTSIMTVTAFLISPVVSMTTQIADAFVGLRVIEFAQGVVAHIVLARPEWC